VSAGTAYAKRYAGGFFDKPSTASAIDSTFLNAVEVALLQLIGAAPTVDGQVMQWDDGNTRYGPALLLNKNVAAGAAIAKSKLDFSGASGIVNADVAGAAAIARSKLDFGAGLVNADISSAAALATNKIANLATSLTGVTVSAANTDITLASALQVESFIGIGTGGGTLRSVSAPTTTGSRLTIRGSSGIAGVTLKHNTAGGSGVVLLLRAGVDALLSGYDVYEFIYDGTQWLEVSRTVTGSACWTFTGKNNGAKTAITMGALLWDDIGMSSWTGSAFSTVPVAGRYVCQVYSVVSGQTGAGSGHIYIDRTNSALVVQDAMSDQDGISLNNPVNCAGAANFVATDRIVVSQSNGATGAAGSMAGRVLVLRTA